MILVKTLWDRLKVLTKAGTSGYFTAEEFNSNLYSVQYTVLSILCDNYENSQKVSDALINHIKTYTGSTTAAGKMFAVSIEQSLSNYYRTLALNFSGSELSPSKKIAVNEVGMYSTSPIRKADLTKNRTLYYFVDNNIQTLPKQSLPFSFIYCVKPALAKIAFTTAEDEDNDYLVVDNTNTVNIDFPEGLFNLFAYLMLESMGIEQKESLASEYAQLGINRTIQTDIK